MTIAAISPRSGRRLTAAGRARREKLESAKHRRKILAVGGAVAIVLAAPLSIAAFMGVDASIPGIEAAKSFMAMMAERSPGNRTKAELTKIKQAAAPAPTQRALGKITKPEPPKEFVEAIAPPLPVIEELPPVALKEDIGPLLLTPQPPGGAIITPPQAPPPGGGGPNPPPPPGEEPPPPPPPAVPEPGTWATMLLGFGLTGWAMRRRRRQTAAALTIG
jgi:PEP-CTERM motif